MSHPPFGEGGLVLKEATVVTDVRVFQYRSI